PCKIFLRIVKEYNEKETPSYRGITMANTDTAYANILYSDEPVEICAQIRADQLLALELIQNAEQRRRRIDCDISALVQQALDMLIKSRLVAIKLAAQKLRIGE